MSEGNTLQELEARRNEARRRREAAEAAADKARQLEVLKLEVEAEERAAKEAEAFAKLEAEHGPIGKRLLVVNTDAGAVVVKRPNHVLWKRFQDKPEASGAIDKIVSSCLVYPSKVEFEALCEEVPAALMLAAEAVCRLAGINRQDLAGK
jgi:hypothetical protein